MSDRLLEWLAVLIFVVGSFGAFLQIRDFYYWRGHPTPTGARIVQSRDEGEADTPDLDNIVQELLTSVCIGLFQSGLQGVDGQPPLCLGKKCSGFEHCVYYMMRSRAKIDKFSRSETGRRIIAEWGGEEMSDETLFSWSNDSAEIIDVQKSPVSKLTYEEARKYRIRELLEYDEGNLKSKISVYADGKLRQAVSIVAEHNAKLSEHKNRYLLFRHGWEIVFDKFGESSSRIKSVYSEIIHSDNDELAADISAPGRCTLSQCLDAQKRQAIQMYITPEHHSVIGSTSQRMGFSMSDYAVACLWSSILTSDANLPERLKEHGQNLLSEFRRRIDKRLRDLQRVRDEITRPKDLET